MKKLTRTKVLIEKIDAQILKNQARIKTIAKQNFELRKTREALAALPKDKPLTKADLEARDKTNRIGKYYDAGYEYEATAEAEKAAQ